MVSRGPITTAEQAIDRGSEFLAKNNYLIRRPVSARQEGDQWKVVFDISILGPRQVLQLTIEAQSVDISEFTDAVNT